MFDGYKNGILGDQLKEIGFGLKYVIYEEGDGVWVVFGKMVGVYYYGVLVEDGNKFDDFFSCGWVLDLLFGQGWVILGWEEGIVFFKGGIKAIFFILVELGYGEVGFFFVILGGVEFMFYVELGEV